MARPLSVLLQHTTRDFPVSKPHPTLAHDRLQWPTLLGHLESPSDDTVAAALVTAMTLLATREGAARACLDGPGEALARVLGALAAEGTPLGARCDALRCAAALLAHAPAHRGAKLFLEPTLQASLSAACYAPTPLVRELVYAVFAGALPSVHAAAVRAGFADSLVLRLLSELPEFGRNPLGLIGALRAVRALLASSTGRIESALPRALSSGAVTACLRATALLEQQGGTPSSPALTVAEDALSCLGAIAQDAALGRPAILVESVVAVPLLLRLSSTAPTHHHFNVVSGAASCLASLLVDDDGKRAFLCALAGTPLPPTPPASDHGELGGAAATPAAPVAPTPAEVAVGLAPFLGVLDAALASPKAHALAAGAAALALASAIAALAVHPIGRAALLMAGAVARLDATATASSRFGVLASAVLARAEAARIGCLWVP